MKKVIQKLAFGLLLATGLTTSTFAQAQAWQDVGMAGFSNGAANYISLAFSPTSGEPYVAFQDVAYSSSVVVKKFNGMAWGNVGTSGFSASNAEFTSLAFNAAGEPYVAFKDGANSGKATVMKYDGSNWVNVGTAGFSVGIARYTSLAFNATGEPYVAFRDAGISNKATVMKYDGSNWVNVGTAGFSAGLADYNSLAFSATGEPYVAFSDAGAGYKARVMKFDGTNWVNVGTAGFSAGLADYTSLAFNAAGEPYVAFKDGGISPYTQATVMKYDGSNWVYVGAPAFTGSSTPSVSHLSLAFNSSNEPYVAYVNGNSSYKAAVMKFDGTYWANVGTSGFSVGAASSTSLAFNALGEPYVAFSEGAIGQRTSVMKFGAVTQYTVTTSANPTAGGTVSGGGVVNNGSSVTLTATANAGYTFVNWTENGMPFSTNNPLTLTVTVDRTLVAQFEATTYTIITSANPTAGGTVSGGGVVNDGSLVTLTATPNTGYQFVNWTENGMPVSTANPYPFTASADRTLVANFEANPVGTYTITTSANPTAGGTVSGGGNHNSGTSVSLYAEENTGYQFVNWTENGMPVSTANPYTFTASADRTLVAQFEMTTGINDITANTITAMYPNPANSVLNIEVTNISTPLNVQIVDVLGKTVATQTLNTGNNMVDVSGLTNGVYFINSEKGGVTKFVKE